jgi:hypothetical protein
MLRKECSPTALVTGRPALVEALSALLLRPDYKCAVLHKHVFWTVGVPLQLSITPTAQVLAILAAISGLEAPLGSVQAVELVTPQQLPPQLWTAGGPGGSVNNGEQIEGCRLV